MRTNFILIDYENVKVDPGELDLLAEGPFHVTLLLGPDNLQRIPTSLAISMHSLKEKAEYVLVNECGNNALDFYLVYHIGRLVQVDSAACFHIISNDKDYDPLIKQLRHQGINICRRPSISQISLVKRRISARIEEEFKEMEEEVETAVHHLSQAVRNRPGKKEALQNYLKSHCRNLAADKIETLLKLLMARGYVAIVDGKVSYQLPQKTEMPQKDVKCPPKLTVCVAGSG